MAFFISLYESLTKRDPLRKHRLSDAYTFPALISHSGRTEQDLDYIAPINQRRDNTAEYLTGLASIFFATLSVLLLIAYFYTVPTDQHCKRQISTWSPVLDAVEFENGDFLNRPEEPSIYRGTPTHNLESEWEKLWFYGTVPIPKDKMHLINRTADPKWSADSSGSDYRALIEVFHQLHCLDVIRQYTWREYYPKHPDTVSVPFLLTSDNEMMARMHVDHCIEALRLSLMCHGDTTPYLLRIDPQSPSGISPDFSMHHKCVKFEPLVDYMRKQKFQVESHNPH